MNIYKISLYPRSSLPKLVLIKPTEYTWVNNMIKIAKSHPELEKNIIMWRQGSCLDSRLSEHPRIIKNGHSGGSLCWTINISQMVIMTGAKIRKHKLGFGYNPFW